MPRQRKLPSYRHHKSSGQAVVTLGGRDIYLGKHDTVASHDRYRQVVAEWLAHHEQTPASSTTGAMPDTALLSINELFLAYWRFCQGHYVEQGKPTRECANVKDAVRSLVQDYGDMAVREFRPSTLKAVRQSMIDSGLARTTINDRVNRIRRMFKWGVENDLVDASVLHALQAVAPLRRGRSGAREGKGVQPVPKEQLDAVLPHLPPLIKAMVHVQLYTGMRPGELVVMRSGDLDTSDSIWCYSPPKHKTERFGHDRRIYIGQRAQRCLEPYLSPDLDAYIFDPRLAMAERWAERPTHRRSPNTRRKTGRRIRTRYTPTSYLRAIYHACDRAFPPPAHLARRRVQGKRRERWEVQAEWRDRLGEVKWAELQQWQKDHRWHPHQLRHNAATFLRRDFGVEAARLILGHRSIAVTELYAELDQEKAVEIISKVG